jgi:hypothetical protein
MIGKPPCFFSLEATEISSALSKGISNLALAA